MHGAETQATPTVSHIGIQCELLLPPALTSTPTKASVGASKPILSFFPCLPPFKKVSTS